MERLQTVDLDTLPDSPTKPDNDLLTNNNSLPLSPEEKDIVRATLDELTQQARQNIREASAHDSDKMTSSIYDARRQHNPLNITQEWNLTRAYRRISEELKTLQEEARERIEEGETVYLRSNEYIQGLEGLKGEIREKLVLHNIGLSLAYVQRRLNSSIDFEDLVQEATVGILYAIENFDPEVGTKFSTFTDYHMRNRVSGEIRNRNVIRVPEDIRAKIRNKLQEEQAFELKYGRKPTTDELAKKIGISTNEVDELSKIENLSFVTSIHRQIQGEEGSIELSNILPDQNSIDDEKRLYIELSDTLEFILSILNERERDVLRMMHGIGDNIPQTPKHVGEALGISATRVRAIEKTALRKIRKSAKRNSPNY